MKVFKVERAYIPFKAVLSNFEEIELVYFEPNMNQIAKMGEARGVSENLGAMKEVLQQNLKGERACEFIEDLYAEGNVEFFFESLNAELAKIREDKRKNS